jgi:hypothetical protein
VGLRPSKGRDTLSNIITNNLHMARQISYLKVNLSYDELLSFPEKKQHFFPEHIGINAPNIKNDGWPQWSIHA